MKAGPDRKYTIEFREAAVRQVLDGKRSVPQVARALEMSDKTLANWVMKARKGQPLLKRHPAQPVNDLQAENARLRQENARLKLEKEILKNRPRGLPRPIWIETSSPLPTLGKRTWTEAACFLEAFVPVKKPGPGEAADPAVVAPCVTPFRKVI